MNKKRERERERERERAKREFNYLRGNISGINAALILVQTTTWAPEYSPKKLVLPEQRIKEGEKKIHE